MDVVLLIGQSNAKGCGNPEESVVPNGQGYEYVENITGNAMIPLGVTLQGSEGRGTIAPAFANRYQELFHRDICVVHYAVDGSRIKNWNHDSALYLEKALEKYDNAMEYIKKNHPITHQYALWIQGESDAKYGTDPIYYEKKLLEIGQVLNNHGIEKTFVSAIGYWEGDPDYLTRCERIAAIQELACEASDTLVLISKTALTFRERGLLQDPVHYSMEALNLLGKEIAENICLYHESQGQLQLPDQVDLRDARAYIQTLKGLMGG